MNALARGNYVVLDSQFENCTKYFAFLGCKSWDRVDDLSLNVKAQLPYWAPENGLHVIFENVAGKLRQK